VDLVDDGPAPPAWPPVSARPTPEFPEPVAPPVPEELAKALDITSEIPRVRDRDNEAASWNIGSGSRRHRTGEPIVPAAYVPPPVSVPLPQQPAEQRLVAPEPARPKVYADQTMELPIFQELESAWFRPPQASAPDPVPTAAAQGAPYGSAPHVGASPGAPPTPLAPLPYVPPGANAPAVPANGGASGSTTGSTVGTSPTSAGRSPTPEPTWRSAADDGWVAASQAADPQVDGTTSAGLPRRVPMAQLVPGGVEKPTANANRRSPEQVRGLLSAYHRGVQRGRTRTGDDAITPDSTARGTSPQGGKEQEA
jgi:hypothetical protein